MQSFNPMQMHLLYRMFEYDELTAFHCCRVASMVMELCKILEIPDHERELYFTAAALHDIGKMQVPQEIIACKRKVTDTELVEIKKHAQYGESIAMSYGYREEITKLIRGHHERLDGSGYPDKKCGYAVTFGMQVLGICDSMDAMLNERPYRERSLTIEECKAELIKCSEKFSPTLTGVTIKNMDAIVAASYAGLPFGKHP